MYTQFFNLKQSPFSIAPDPRYLFMSERHREALAHLLYGVGSGGGFVLLTGEIGAGKTTVCRCFIEQVPAHCKLAYIFNPKLSALELLASIYDEFGIAHAGSGSAKSHVDAINGYLLDSHAQGINNVLIVDEAQNLASDVLEQLRLLTNLETCERKLLQIILIGQPELRTILARPELEQLTQRVIARYHLGSLALADMKGYIAHRLAVSGCAAPLAATIFPPRLLPLIHRISKGVPRRINLLCDRALLGAYVEDQHQVSRKILRHAAVEVFGSAVGAGALRRWPHVLAGTLAGALISGALVWFGLQHGALPPSVWLPASVPTSALAPSAAVAPFGPGADVRALAMLWDQALPDGAPCEVAIELGLRCYRSNGGLAELRQLDRPALLTALALAVPDALLIGLSDTSATLRIANKDQQISLAALSARFGTEFLTLWRAPSNWRDEVSIGSRGPDVDWLVQRLMPSDAGGQLAANRSFDDALQARLRAFQSGEKIDADGVAGPKTFIRMVRLGGALEPRLLRAGLAGK
jgi:general secretion pathway protein A